MWYNRSLGCVRLCVCVCVCVRTCMCVMYLLHCLCWSAVMLCGRVTVACMCLLQRGYVLCRVFDTRWLLHWPGLVSK